MRGFEALASRQLVVWRKPRRQMVAWFRLPSSASALGESTKAPSHSKSSHTSRPPPGRTCFQKALTKDVHDDMSTLAALLSFRDSPVAHYAHLQHAILACIQHNNHTPPCTSHCLSLPGSVVPRASRGKLTYLSRFPPPIHS